jgi:uncharacterized protein (TIGR03437 family)
MRNATLLVLAGLLALCVLAPTTMLAQAIISPFAGGAPPPTPNPATSVSLVSPSGVAIDSAGNVYLTSQNCIFKVDSKGTLTLIAGNAKPGYSGDGGPATAAQISGPQGLKVDASGNLYIADQGNHAIRKIGSNGVITTIAGIGQSGFSGDGGAATSAKLSAPSDVALDAAGNIYVADTGNSRVRKISTAGVITTFAGNGTFGHTGDGGPATSATLAAPFGAAFDGAGNLYVSEFGSNVVRKITATGIISTYAGTGSSGFSGDNGPATSAAMASPRGIAIDAAGNLYIADLNNQRIRKVTAAGIITTFSGVGNAFGGLISASDGVLATNALLKGPTGVAVDASGNVYLSDSTINSRVRKISGGIINTIAGGQSLFAGDGGPATSAQLNIIHPPSGMATDAAGNVYIADTYNNRIRKVAPSGIITTMAGNGTGGYSGDGGPATSAQLQNPTGLAMDAAGNLYIADTNNNAFRVVSPAGVISTLFLGSSATPDSSGRPLAGAGVTASGPLAVATDSQGNKYLADTGGHRIIKVSPPDGAVTIFAGTGASGSSGLGGPATAAQISTPTGIAVDSNGNVYVADSGNQVVLKINSAGIISVFAGVPGKAGYSGDGGPAILALIYNIFGLFVDSQNNVFILDTNNNVVRAVTTDGIIHTVVGNDVPGVPTPFSLALGTSLGLPSVGTALGSGFVIADVNGVYKVAQPVCTVTLTPPRRFYGPAAISDGFGVTVSSGCTWTVALDVNPGNFITLQPSTSPTTVAFKLALFQTTPSSTTRTGTIVVTATGASPSATATATFTVSQSPCTYVWSPGSISIPEDGGTAKLTVTTSGDGCPWTVDTPNLWISLNPDSGAGDGHSPQTVTITVTQATVFFNRVGSIYATGLPGVLVNGILQPAAIPVIQALDPVANPGGAIGSAVAGPPSAGSATALYGTNLDTDDDDTETGTLPLPTTAGAGGASVTITAGGPSIDGKRGPSAVTIGPINAPLFFVSANQINFQMPWEFIGQSQVSLTVTAFGKTSAPITVKLANPSPGIYSINQQGNGQGAIQIANTAIFAAPSGSIPGAQAQPATAGNFLTIYCTGLGAVSNQPADGAAAPSSPLAQTTLTPTVTIGGANAPVSFSGLTPGFVGLYQVNVQVPAGVPTGNAVPLILSIGGVASNTVTIAVQ